MLLIKGSAFAAFAGGTLGGIILCEHTYERSKRKNHPYSSTN